MRSSLPSIPVIKTNRLAKIAIPMGAGRFSEHFGGATEFHIYDADADKGGLAGVRAMPAPEHKPGSLPAWLIEQDVDAVVVSAIGERALMMLSAGGIKTYLADGTSDPAQLAIACLLGNLPHANQENSRCAGGHHDHEHGHDHGHSCHHG